MYAIKTKADLERFRQSGLFSPAYCKAVEEYFSQLTEALSPSGCDPEKYDLENDGYIVVLDIRDSPRSLPEVGLPNGLTSTYPGPEFVETVSLPDETNLYRIMYLYDNDYAMTFYLDTRLWQDDQEFQQFLQDQLEL